MVSITKVPYSNFSNHIVEGNMKMQKSSLPKKFSSISIDEKQRKSLCYHCKEKWNPSHMCKTPRIYLLQDYEESEDKEEAKELVLARAREEKNTK